MTAGVAIPPRPDPWATTEPREALRDTNAARIVSMTPGMTPSSGGDYPANMVDFCGHDENYVEDVSFTGQKAMVLRSKTQHVHNGGNGGACEPIGHAAQVRAGGSPLIRHGDSFYMDDRRTVGEATFVRDTTSYPAPKDTDPIPGSVRTTMSQATSGPEVMSDANPDPSYWRPGAQLALLDEHGQFTRPPGGTTQPGPVTRPVPPAQKTPQGSSGSGLWGDLMFLLGMGEAGHELGDQAGRAFVGPDGVRGRELSDTLTDSAPSPFSPQGQEIGRALGQGGMGPIDGTNTLLSLKDGRLLDFRTMPQHELDELLRKPWPSADEIRRNADKLEVRRQLLERMKPGTLPTSNIRVTSQCRIETICFDKEETNDSGIPMKFDEQLKMQQDALNAKTPAQVLGSIPPNGEVENLRPLARSAQARAKRAYETLNRKTYLSNHSQEQWDDRLSKLNALHRLDMVAGGSPTDIVGMGDADANQAIGREWPADSRRGALRRYAAEMTANRCPMNVRLTVCPTAPAPGS